MASGLHAARIHLRRPSCSNFSDLPRDLLEVILTCVGGGRLGLIDAVLGFGSDALSVCTSNVQLRRRLRRRRWDGSCGPVRPLSTLTAGQPGCGSRTLSVAQCAGGDIVSASKSFVHRWTMRDGAPAHKSSVDCGEVVRSVANIPEGSCVAAGAKNGDVFVVADVVKQRVRLHSDWLWSVSAVRVDGGAVLLSGGEDGHRVVRLLDDSEGLPVLMGPAMKFGSAAVMCTQMSELGDMYAFAGRAYNGSYLSVSSVQGDRVTEADLGRDLPWCAEWHSSGRSLFCAVGRRLLDWDLHRCPQPRVVGWGSDWLLCVRRSGDRVAVGSQDGTLTIWDSRRVCSGQPLSKLTVPDPGGPVRSIVFTEDVLVTVHEDNRVVWWDEAGR